MEGQGEKENIGWQKRRDARGSQKRKQKLKQNPKQKIQKNFKENLIFPGGDATYAK